MKCGDREVRQCPAAQLIYGFLYRINNRETLRERSREWRIKNLDRYRKRVREWGRLRYSKLSPKERWAKNVMGEVRKRSKKLNMKTDVTKEYIVSIIPELCPITLRKLAFGGVCKADWPSLDKIIPALGYIKGNVAVISTRANRIKNDCSDPEIFERISEYIRKNTDGQLDPRISA